MRLLCIWLLAALPALVAAEDFGEASWGDSPDDVRNAETRPNRTPIGEFGYLIYEAELPDIYVTRLVYQFTDGQLTQGRFLFKPSPEAPMQSWIDQFEQVRHLISRQYGEPMADEVLTPASESRPERLDWAEALSEDRLVLKTRWQNDRTELVQQLAWAGDRPYHQVIYRPLAPVHSADSLF
ncbi:hypothetical protein [Saccharospirillum mangrovi]|uniref:hypothetical protein n=1 Tax=Saccharospirillum mangrovi TaxID=2161747 RepID=UPI000D3764B3|nr:hypothetical protein [Saccharospirillum mangrovi]